MFPSVALMLLTKFSKHTTVENESTLFSACIYSPGMESGRPRTDAEYINVYNIFFERRFARHNRLYVVAWTYKHNCRSQLCNNPSKKPKLVTTIMHPFCSPVKILIGAISGAFTMLPIWIALKISLQVWTEAAFNSYCKCKPYNCPKSRPQPSYHSNITLPKSCTGTLVRDTELLVKISWNYIQQTPNLAQEHESAILDCL